MSLPVANRSYSPRRRAPTYNEQEAREIMQAFQAYLLAPATPGTDRIRSLLVEDELWHQLVKKLLVGVESLMYFTKMRAKYLPPDQLQYGADNGVAFVLTQRRGSLRSDAEAAIVCLRNITWLAEATSAHERQLKLGFLAFFTWYHVVGCHLNLNKRST